MAGSKVYMLEVGADMWAVAASVRAFTAAMGTVLGAAWCVVAYMWTAYELCGL